ncbi:MULTISPECIES: bifunctional diguanylate cyclase/phosphodiesterase [unclassified Paenibacillus]|uniref:putative bifunctional diguanylate cyclase/phosphodiesterase n=1 Tax=unclassified Paenibacillus TaxID=185978 RepID=UPI001C119F80|nr:MULTISPECIES: EAL domain-containing protein [unclassified Paenibacillus]MBU5443332.1 EAL domain-containing protein [Paenibacillus sp. MSJ-34]CAH0118887.1 hypothetical protein PAE9249_01384 [Paenibacillus sp. CECT 9249]
MNRLKPFASVRSLVIFVLFVAAALLGTRFAIHFSFGAYFLICSAFLFVVLRLFGLMWSGLAALFISVFAYYALDGSFLLLLIGLEIILVGSVYEKKQKYLFIWDGLYWVLIGAPLAAVLFYLQSSVLSSEVYLQILMLTMNGLLNGLLGDVLNTYLPWKRLFPHMEERRIHLSQLLTHLSIVAVTGPFLLNMVLDSFQLNEKIQSDSYQFAMTQSLHAVGGLRSMNDSEWQGLRSKSPEQVDRLSGDLAELSANGVVKLAVFYNGELAAASDEHWFAEENASKRLEGSFTQIGDLPDWPEEQAGEPSDARSAQFYRWIPASGQYDYETTRWNNGFYILTTEWQDRESFQIVAAIPISYFQSSTVTAYLNKYIVMFLFCVIATITSLFFNYFMMRPMNQLARMTTGLPQKLKDPQVIEWPRTALHEIASLVTNFRLMAQRLLDMFGEMKRMNDRLLEQTKMLETSEERLQKLAYYDTLTGLPNRHHFTLYMERALEEAKMDGHMLALLFIDLDRFKHINDTLGHDIGDMFLVEVAKRLTVLFNRSNNSIFARLGGDEFVVVLQDTNRREIEKQAGRIVRHLADPFQVKSYELFVAASVGISVYPTDADAFTAMLKNADTAMYIAKDNGGNHYQFYDLVKPDRYPERMLLENRLRKALERHELLLYYQPLLDETGTIIAAEALIRWEHPEEGFIPPAKFIPLAEETGLIIPIGEWVLRTACLQHQIWHKAGLPKIPMSVNVSLRQFLNQDFVETVDRILQETEYEASDLILEITEGYVNENAEQAVQVLRRLRKRGIQIAIDDFGTGYSSLSRLKRLPIHILKIDQSFVRRLPSDRTNAAIVQAVIQLGQSLNVKVAAEGIESEKELEFLKSHGCDRYQGFLISEPLSAHQFALTYPNFAAENIRGMFEQGGNATA